MSITDKARKLTQSFLTMDDLVLGQSLVGGGLNQMGRLGISASGPSVALNVASRFLCLGAQVVTRAAEAPLPGEAGKLAGKMSDEAKTLGERCSNLAVQGIEMAGGKKPQNPITKEEWLNKRAQPGYTAGELAADTLFGTLQSLTMMPVSMGRDALSLSSSWSGSDKVRKAVDATFDNLPAGAKEAESVGLREGLAALALESGSPFMQTTMALADAAARLAFSDTRALREELKKGLARARLLAEEDPPPVSSRLRESARKLANNPPKEFMAALERGPNGKAPGFFEILNAMIKDRRALSVFATAYPQMMGFLGSDLMAVLVGGPAGKRVAGTTDKEDESGTSARFTVLDSLVGSAVTSDDETPLFSRATVFLAQDLSYLTHRDRHGRESALDRVERLFGAQARERITADVSLNADLMVKEGRPLAERLSDYIRNIADGNALSRQIDLGAERLALLESSEASAQLTMTRSLTERIDALRLFTSLAACDLAMRGTPPSATNTSAKAAFLAWASEQG